MQFHIGGMEYDSHKKRGVKKKYIPTPEEIELSFDASLEDVLQKGKEIFFEDLSPHLTSLVLADSNGHQIPISADDEEDWTIGEFYNQNDYKPSRYKLYVMYCPQLDVSL